jgi:hypothetical protein
MAHCSQPNAATCGVRSITALGYSSQQYVKLSWLTAPRVMDLRHHYVSVLLDAGETVVAVAERIGDTPERVWRTYAHLMPGGEDKTRRAIDAAWSDRQITDTSHG